MSLIDIVIDRVTEGATGSFSPTILRVARVFRILRMGRLLRLVRVSKSGSGLLVQERVVLCWVKIYVYLIHWAYQITKNVEISSTISKP